MAGITSTGLGSGLNINDIVSKLVAAERAGDDSRLTRDDAMADARISGFGSFKGALSTFRSSLTALKSAGNFQKVTATPGDPTVFTATADKNAELGNYNIAVQQLAQGHTLVAGRVATPDTTLGTGTLTIKFGTTDYDATAKTYNGFTQDATKGALTLNIDSTNNTLVGVRDAINKAKAGVTASVVNDGTGYRLVLSSSQTGAKSSMEISVADSDGNNTDTSGLSQFAFNSGAQNLEQMQTAQDAKFTLNGLPITSAANTVTNTLKGVTLNLLKAPAAGQTATPVSLAVTQNSDDIKTNVDAFVKAFNELNTTVKDLTAYDVKTKQGGILQGEGVVRNGMTQLRSMLAGFLASAGKDTPTLTSIGLDIQKDGTLTLDNAKLDDAIKNNREGVAAVFSVLGRPSDSGVLFKTSSKDTKSGDYAVNITQAATQGLLNGGAVGASLAVDANNDTFSVKVDGVSSGTITLTQKDYSADPSGLAAEMQAKINGDATLRAKGAAVTVTYDADNKRFVLQSKTFGSTSKVEITAADTNSESTLGLKVASSTADGTDGKDVAGTIGGVPAEGKGQELTAKQGPANGLALTISDSKTGDRGTVNFSRGLSESLDRILGGILDSKGSLTARTDGLDKDKARVAEERTKLDERMAAYEKRMLAKFNAMDAIYARMSSMGNYLNQALANLPYSNRGN